MHQFAVTPDREQILTRIPDYAVTISPTDRLVTATFQGKTLAETRGALLVQETRHNDVYYLPRKDVRMDLLEPTNHSTYCPFKGHATYWSVKGAGEEGENLVWSYETPDVEVEDLAHYLAFYAGKADIKVS